MWVFDKVTRSRFADLGLLSQHNTDILFAFTLKSMLVWMVNIRVLRYLKAEGGEPVERA